MHFDRKSDTATEKHLLVLLGPRDAKRVAIGTTTVIVIVALLMLLVNRPTAQGVNACNNILLQQQRYSCLASLALQRNNESICEGIGNLAIHDSCILAVVENTHNASQCTGIDATSSNYVYCVLDVGGYYKTADYCNVLQEPYRSQCLYDFAARTGYSNATVCKDINNATLEPLCNNMVDFANAISSSDAAACADFPTSNDTSLMEAMTVYRTGNTTYAYMRAVGYQHINMTPRDYCYITLANVTMNSSICSLTGSALAGTLCNTTSSIRNSTPIYANSTAVCDNVPSYLKEGCLYSITMQNAVATKNVSACESLPEQQYRDACFAAIASQYGNTSFCSYISNMSTKEGCMFNST